MAIATKTDAQVFIAIEGFVAEIDGSPVNFRGDHTRVSAAWLGEHENLRHLFRPIEVHHDVEQATAAPGEKR
jgi:hypothetical protein